MIPKNRNIAIQIHNLDEFEFIINYINNNFDEKFNFKDFYPMKWIYINQIKPNYYDFYSLGSFLTPADYTEQNYLIINIKNLLRKEKLEKICIRNINY